MPQIAFIKCPSCTKLPRPKCKTCDGLGGTYDLAYNVSPEQEEINKTHINSLQEQYKKTIEKRIWPHKTRSYFTESLAFLEQYKSDADVQLLITKLNHNLKFQILSEIKTILTHLKSKPSLEYFIRYGSEPIIRGKCVSFLGQDGLLRISLFSGLEPRIIPTLRMLDVRKILIDSSIYSLSSKGNLIFSNSSETYKPILPDQLAVVKISINYDTICYFIPKDTFDSILSAS